MTVSQLHFHTSLTRPSHVRIFNGCAMAQAVSNRHLTVEAQVSPCGICCGQSGIGTGSSPSSLVSPHQYHSLVVLQTHISSAGCTRADADRHLPITVAKRM